jgi:hypothetical protein
MANRIPMQAATGESFFTGLNRGSQMMQRLMQDKRMQQQLAINQAAEERAAQFQPYQIQQQNRLADEFELAKQLHPYKLQEAEQKNNLAPLEYKQLEAKINAENEKASALRKFGSQRPSAAVQEALMIYGDPSAPGFNEYVFNRNRMNPQEEPSSDIDRLKLAGAKSISHLSPAERKSVTDRQNKFIDQGEAWKHINHQLDEADKILDAHPSLADSAASIIEEAGAKNKGYLNPILNRATDKNDRTAVQSLDKIYSDIVLSLDAAMPGRGSVFKLQTITAAKGRSKNTNETNRFINESLRREGTPFINYARDLKKIKGKYDLDFDRDKYANSPLNEIPSKVSSPTAMGMMKGIMNGQEIDVDPQDREDFIQAGGQIL